MTEQSTPPDSQKQSTYLLSRCIRSPCNATSGSGETPLPDIVPNYLVLLQRRSSAFAAYCNSGASGSQYNAESLDITAAHPPLPRCRSKPLPKTSRATAGPDPEERPRTIAAEDEDESIDLAISEVPDDEMSEHEEPLAAKPAPRSTRSKAGAKAPTSLTKPKKPGALIVTPFANDIVRTSSPPALPVPEE